MKLARRPFFVVLALSMVLTAAAATASAHPSGTVSGTVMLDGAPLAGVEVFLWEGFPRLTCTDANGEFTFDDVTLDVDLVSATGPGEPSHCKNWRFRAPNGDQLLTQFYDGHDGVQWFDVFRVTAAAPDFIITYTPRVAAANAAVCYGQLATIKGTPGDDVLVGGPGLDVIVGGGGNDTIKGFGGSDVLCGGAGRDVILGGADADWIEGGLGADRIDAGIGTDVVLGNGGRDRIKGNGGADVIYGFAGNDVLSGGAQGDILRGGWGDDTLNGNKGSDKLYGNRGTDIADGGPGADTCVAETKISC